MTMHAAKGLDFDVVFLPGWEEGLFLIRNLWRKRKFCFRRRKKISLCRYYKSEKGGLFIFAMKRAYHGDWMDALPSRFINEIPDESVEKNEIENTLTDDFEFNQDNSIEFDDEYRSPGWDRYKKNKLLKWKIKKLKNFLREKIDGYLVPKNDEFFGEYVSALNDRLNFIPILQEHLVFL